VGRWFSCAFSAVLLRHPTNRWYRSLRVPVAHPVAETACSRGMKDTDAHGALIYQRIFEMFSLKVCVICMLWLMAAQQWLWRWR